MPTVTFDTLKFANQLKQAGVAAAHAEAEAQALGEVFEISLNELSTKADLQHLEDRMTSQMALLEQRMTIKLGGLMVIAVGVVATLVKLL